VGVKVDPSLERGTCGDGFWEGTFDKAVWARRKEVTGDWRRLHSEELLGWYC